MILSAVNQTSLRKANWLKDFISSVYQWGVCDSRLFDYLYFRDWRVLPSTWNHSNYGCQRCQLWSFSSSKVIEEGREAQNIQLFKCQYASGYHAPYMYISFILNPYILFRPIRKQGLGYRPILALCITTISFTWYCCSGGNASYR